MHKAQGFTLVELLIAVTILSLLMFTGTYVYSALSTRWDAELGDFENSTQRLNGLAIIESVLSGCMPWVTLEQKGDYTDPSFFFVGDQSSLLGVTRRGVFDRDYPEIFRFTRIENPDQTYDLIYQARSTRNLLLTGTDQSIDFQYKVTVLKQVSDVNFRYYGFENFAQRSAISDTDQAPPRNWYSQYSGITNKLMPDLIEFRLLTDDNWLTTRHEIDAKSVRLITRFLEGDEG